MRVRSLTAVGLPPARVVRNPLPAPVKRPAADPNYLGLWPIPHRPPPADHGRPEHRTPNAESCGDMRRNAAPGAAGEHGSKPSARPRGGKRDALWKGYDEV